MQSGNGAAGGKVVMEPDSIDKVIFPQGRSGGGEEEDGRQKFKKMFRNCWKGLNMEKYYILVRPFFSRLVI